MTNSQVKGLSKCGTEMPWRPIVQQEKKIEIALFRLGTIAPIVYGEYLQRGDKEALIRSLTEQKVRIPYSLRSRLARSTIMEWASMYEQSGRRLQSLFPRDRSDRGVPRSIRAEEKNTLLDYLERNPTTFACRAYRNLFEQGIMSSRLSPSSLSRILKAEKMTRRDRLERLKAKQLTEAVQLPRNEYEWGLWMLRLLQGKVDRKNIQGRLKGKLGETEIDLLLSCIKEKPRMYRNRAMAVVASLCGIPTATVVSFLCMSRSGVGGILERSQTSALSCLLGFERDRKRKYEDQSCIDAVFRILHAPPSDYGINRTTWKLDDIHRVMCEMGLPIWKHGITLIIRNAGYTFTKAKKVLTSNDPNYREKLSAITRILADLGPDEKFFSIDEFGPFSVKMQGGKSLMPKGQRRTVPQWQRSKGQLLITAALELSTNQITHFYSTKKNTGEMIKMLMKLLRQYPDEKTIYISWDAASWHVSKALKETVDEINNTEERRSGKSPLVKLTP
ncbi:MAG TPA: hypothetical protein ENI27_02880 [bacterium]|nr:hypothetical protein [bacterium]